MVRPMASQDKRAEAPQNDDSAQQSERCSKSPAWRKVVVNNCEKQCKECLDRILHSGWWHDEFVMRKVALDGSAYNLQTITWT